MAKGGEAELAKKKRSDEGGGYSWMDTYGDMVTLLLTFFVLLFASSTVDAEKFSILVRAFSNAAPAADTAQIALPGEGDQAAPPTGTTEGEIKIGEEELADPKPIDLEELFQYLKAYVESNNMTGQVKVEKGVNSVYLRFDNNIFFDGDSSILRQTSYPVLKFMGECFKNVEDKILFIRINGHTAAVPGNDNYMVNDWDLSTLRACRVASNFEKAGIKPAKLMTQGYGKNYPIASNDTPEGRAKNRRVDIMILGNEFDTTDAQQMLDVLNKTLNVDFFDDKSNSSDIVTPPSINDGTADAAVSAAEQTTAPVETPQDAQATLDAAVKIANEENAKK